MMKSGLTVILYSNLEGIQNEDNSSWASKLSNRRILFSIARSIKSLLYVVRWTY
jgi:hypothetical protein